MPAMPRTFRVLPSRRRMLQYILILPILYILYCAVLYLVQDRFVFPRDLLPRPRAAGQFPPDVNPVTLNAGTEAAPVIVEAWFLPPLRPAPGPAPAVICFHGNAELIDSAVDSVHDWRRRGYAVLLPEYRGYGRSGGQPSQAALTEDAVRFYDILAARPDIDPERILFHGRSIGGGIACQLAAVRPPAAMVLESTFTSAASFTWSLGAPPFLARHPFRSDRILPTLDRPVLFLHGIQDDIVPIAHSRTLHRLTPGSALVELDGGHNDFPRDARLYRAAIDAFLASHGLPSP